MLPMTRDFLRIQWRKGILPAAMQLENGKIMLGSEERILYGVMTLIYSTPLN